MGAFPRDAGRVALSMAIVAFSYFCYIDAVYREQEEDKARLHRKLSIEEAEKIQQQHVDDRTKAG